MVTWLVPMRRARAAALEAKKGLPTAPAAWYTCPRCGAHQSQEIAPLAICFCCQRSMLEPVRLADETGGE